MTDSPQFLLHGVPIALDAAMLTKLGDVEVDLKLDVPPPEEAYQRVGRCMRLLDLERRYAPSKYDALSPGEQALFKGALHAAYLHGVRSWPARAP